MRSVGKRDSRFVYPLFAAAGIVAVLGVPAAQADFIVSVTTINGPIDPSGTSGPVGAGETEYVLSALNNGLNRTGTTLIGVDVTITSNNPMVIDLGTDFDGDGQLDADIVGFSSNSGASAAIPTFGVYNSATDPNNGFAGSMVGIAQPETGKPQNLAYANTSLDVDAVQIGANINNNVFNNYETTQGPLDPAFLNGTVTSLRVVGAFASTSFKGPVASQTPIPFANVVVPNATSGTVLGFLAGDSGAIQPFDVSYGSAAQGPSIELASTALPGTSQIANGGIEVRPFDVLDVTYMPIPAKIAVTGAAQTRGELFVYGFTPSQTELYGLAGSNTAASAVASLISEWNTAAAAADAGATVVATSSLPLSLQPVFAGDQIVAIFPGTDAVNPNV